MQKPRPFGRPYNRIRGGSRWRGAFILKRPLLVPDITFIWKIKNFEVCPDQCLSRIVSPEFRINTWKKPTFHLLLYPGGVNEKYSDYLSVRLVETSSEEENVTYSCDLGIITSRGKQVCSTFRGWKLNQGKAKCLAKFFEKDKLNSPLKRYFLPDGDLTIFCYLKEKRLQEMKLFYNIKYLEELSNIYEDIYKSGKFCDIFFHIGDETFKVHRAILEARFPDLLKNSDGNKCTINGIGSKTFSAVLHYIYTGYLKIQEMNLFEIFSSNYELPSHLKRLLTENYNKIEVTTCFHKEVICFSWDVRNLSKLDYEKFLQYPIIGDYKKKWTWLDIFISLETDDKGEEYMDISVQRFSKDCSTLICTMEISDITETVHHNFGNADKWALPHFFSKDMLKNRASDANSDTHNFNFEITVSNGAKTDELEKKTYARTYEINQRTSDLNSFEKDLSKIQNDPEIFDVTIISGNEKIPAHKFMLGTHSSVFCDMLEMKPSEEKHSEIIIDDIDAETLKYMLEYMYNDTTLAFMFFEIKETCNMHTAAKKYKLTELKEKCFNDLECSLKTENAGHILIIADENNDEEIKELVYDFVCKHPSEMNDSKEWGKVMSERNDLAAEVLKKTLAYLAAKNDTTT